MISNKQPNQYQLCLGFNIGLDCQNAADIPIYKKEFSQSEIASVNPFCMRNTVVTSKDKCPKQCKYFTLKGNSWCSPSCPKDTECVSGGGGTSEKPSGVEFEITCSNCNLSLQGTILYEAYARITGGWTPHRVCIWWCFTIHTPWIGFEYAVGFG